MLDIQHKSPSGKNDFLGFKMFKQNLLAGHEVFSLIGLKSKNTR
jgi:hypothetical protein